jgi:uroporphyrinogen III methyltransferase/synthase
LITRAADDAVPLRRRLETLGAQVLELPAIEIVPPEDSTPLDIALRALETFDWIAFTSRRAVRAVFDRLSTLGLSGELPCRVAAVGPATEAELAERGINVDCRPTEARAAALGDALRRHGVAGRDVLLPTGDLALPDLRAGLEAAGARVVEIVAYRTLQPLEARSESIQALRRGGVDAIALASPSAARNLAAMLGADIPLLQHVRLVCIGPATAAAVRELGLEPAAVAGEHTLDGLVTGIVEAFSGETV